MLALVILLLVILWFLGYVTIPYFTIPNIVLFTVNGHDITLWSVLIFLVILWAVGILPSPLRQIIFAGLIIWILASFGILFLASWASFILAAIIVGLLLGLLGA